MLPKKQRLNLRHETDKLIFKAPSFCTQHFRFFYHPSTEFKAAAVIPVKQERQAVARNKLRRQVYSVLEVDPITDNSVWILVMAIKPLNIDKPELRKEIQFGLDKIKNVINN